jgi:hypothetical protein
MSLYRVFAVKKLWFSNRAEYRRVNTKAQRITLAR